jgi:hypothetical protein
MNRLSNYSAFYDDLSLLNVASFLNSTLCIFRYILLLCMYTYYILKCMSKVMYCES